MTTETSTTATADTQQTDTASENRPTFLLVGLLFGALFGGVLAGAQLHEYATIHAMLSLEEFDVFLLMGSAVAVATPLLWLAERNGITTPLGGALELSRPGRQPHHVKGAALFGIGWAVAGTCPAPALVMLSSGALLSLVTIPGIFLGLYLRERQVLRRLTGSLDLRETGTHR